MRLGIVLTVLLSAVATPVLAQEQAASIEGTVKDPSGAVIAGARVEASGATGLAVSAVTGATGRVCAGGRRRRAAHARPDPPGRSRPGARGRLRVDHRGKGGATARRPPERAIDEHPGRADHAPSHRPRLHELDYPGGRRESRRRSRLSGGHHRRLQRKRASLPRGRHRNHASHDRECGAGRGHRRGRGAAGRVEWIRGGILRCRGIRDQRPDAQRVKPVEGPGGPLLRRRLAARPSPPVHPAIARPRHGGAPGLSQGHFQCGGADPARGRAAQKGRGVVLCGARTGHDVGGAHGHLSVQRPDRDLREQSPHVRRQRQYHRAGGRPDARAGGVQHEPVRRGRHAAFPPRRPEPR
jgi:hypothetical protein